MIFDKLKNRELYESINSGFALGFDFIEKCIKENLPVGKYEIDGKKVYASVQEYDGKEEENARFEGHRNYIDIQYIVSGNEQMIYSDISQCKSSTDYNPEKDVEFFTDAKNPTRIMAEENDFAVFFPNDIHAPGIKSKDNAHVKKVVVKIAL